MATMALLLLCKHVVILRSRGPAETHDFMCPFTAASSAKTPVLVFEDLYLIQSQGWHFALLAKLS